MNRETIYASLAGCVGFIVIAFASYWYFSPAVPAKSASAIPADTKGPAPVPVQPAPPGDAFPAPAPTAVAPTRPAPPAASAAPTPTAYGASLNTGPQAAHSSPTVQSPQDDGERPRTFRARNPSSQLTDYPKSRRSKRMQRRAAEEDE